MMSPHENWMSDGGIATVITPFFQKIPTSFTVAALTYAQLNFSIFIQ